jgi:hypothetical protein
MLRRMLLPNERVSSHGEESVKMLRSQRPELEELALQRGLEVERHTWLGERRLRTGATIAVLHVRE